MNKEVPSPSQNLSKTYYSEANRLIDLHRLSSINYVPLQKVYHISSIVDPLPIQNIFPKMQPIEIDLGAGDGGFIIEYATRHPERNFIAVERLLGRLRKIDKKAQLLKLDNLIGMRIEASYLVRYLLPPQSVSVFHIYFPDPWPKRKHHHRRLIQSTFVESAWYALELGGTIYIRTDNKEYFEHIVECFKNHPGYEETYIPAELLSIPTDFELEFITKGIRIYKIAFRKRVK